MFELGPLFERKARMRISMAQCMDVESDCECDCDDVDSKHSQSFFCSGCHRVFYSQTNFSKHFFCPYRGKSPDKHGQFGHSLPVIYVYLNEEFYYPQHIASLLEMLFEEMDSYIYEDAILELNRTMTLDMKRHLVLFLPDYIAKHIELF